MSLRRNVLRQTTRTKCQTLRLLVLRARDSDYKTAPRTSFLAAYDCYLAHPGTLKTLILEAAKMRCLWWGCEELQRSTSDLQNLQLEVGFRRISCPANPTIQTTTAPQGVGLS